MSHSVGLQKLKLCTYKDILMCVPGNDINTKRTFILARKDLAEQLAPDGIETLEEYGEFMAKVKEKYPMMVPGYIDALTFFQAYIQANGYFQYSANLMYKSLDPDRWEEYYSIEQTEEFGTAFYMLKDWYDKKYIQPTGDPGMWLGMGGMASVLVSGHELEMYTAAGATKYEFVAFPLYMETPHEVEVNSTGLSVCNSSDHPERVMMFIEWLHSSQEAYDLFTYGVKDRNYVLNGDKIAYYSEDNSIKPINNWYLIPYFKDFRYDRLQEFHPKEYKEVYKKACLENIFTKPEIEEKVLGITAEKEEKYYADKAAVSEFQKEYDRVARIYNKYTNTFINEMRLITRGVFWHEPAELREIMKETGIEEYIELINDRLKKMREK
jgi:hypothetical protein